jgi:hypothetical protein
VSAWTAELLPEKKYRPLKLEASVSGFHGVELIDQLIKLTGRYLPPKVRIN